MRRYCLKSVFNAKGVHLIDELEIRLRTGVARFVKSASFKVMDVDTVGESLGGTVSAEVSARDETFYGNPFLVEVVVFDNVSETADLRLIRRQLEMITEDVVSILHWASPGTLCDFLASAMFKQDANNGDGWNWEYAITRIAAPFYNEASKLQRAVSDQETLLSNLAEERDTIILSLRWLRKADNSQTSIDQYIALWIILESLAGQLSKEESLRAGIMAYLETLYPAMNKKQRKSLANLLYKTRNNAVHRGSGDISVLPIINAITRELAIAGLSFIIHKHRPAPLSEDLLNQLSL